MDSIFSKKTAKSPRGCSLLILLFFFGTKPVCGQETEFFVKGGLGAFHGKNSIFDTKSAVSHHLEALLLKDGLGLSLRGAWGIRGLGGSDKDYFLPISDENSGFTYIRDLALNDTSKFYNNVMAKMASLEVHLAYYPIDKKGFVEFGVGLSKQKNTEVTSILGFSPQRVLLEYRETYKPRFAAQYGYRFGRFYFEQGFFRGIQKGERIYTMSGGLLVPFSPKKEKEGGVSKSSWKRDYQKYRFGIGWSMLAPMPPAADIPPIQVPQASLQFGFPSHLVVGLSAKFPLARNQVYFTQNSRAYLQNPLSNLWFYALDLQYDIPVGDKEFITFGTGLNIYKSEKGRGTFRNFWEIGCKSGIYQSFLKLHAHSEVTEAGFLEFSWSVGLCKIKKKRKKKIQLKEEENLLLD